MKKIGRKTREWLRARKNLIADLEKSGEYNVVGSRVYGNCKDCHYYRLLTPDHKIKRSQGGKHTKENIDWVCIPCHRERDQMGDPKKRKPKSKKADWSKLHKCKKCKRETSMYLCHHCQRPSI